MNTKPPTVSSALLDVSNQSETKTTSVLKSATKPNFDLGTTTTPSALLGRLQNFLPLIKQANENLVHNNTDQKECIEIIDCEEEEMEHFPSTFFPTYNQCCGGSKQNSSRTYDTIRKWWWNMQDCFILVFVHLRSSFQICCAQTNHQTIVRNFFKLCNGYILQSVPQKFLINKPMDQPPFPSIR